MLCTTSAVPSLWLAFVPGILLATLFHSPLQISLLLRSPSPAFAETLHGETTKRDSSCA